MTAEPRVTDPIASFAADKTADSEPRRSPALAALCGLAAGAVGVWALDRLDWFLFEREPEEARERTRAARPGGEAPAGLLVTRASETAGVELSDGAHSTAEVLTHYAIGIAPAIGYALARDRLPAQGSAQGLAQGALFGAGLWLVQDEIINTVTGLGAKPTDYPWQAHARGLAAHTAYGIVTEATLQLLEATLPQSR